MTGYGGTYTAPGGTFPVRDWQITESGRVTLRSGFRARPGDTCTVTLTGKPSTTMTYVGKVDGWLAFDPIQKEAKPNVRADEYDPT